MFDVRYKGLRLIPSKIAMQEMTRFGFMIRDCKNILEMVMMLQEKELKIERKDG